MKTRPILVAASLALLLPATGGGADGKLVVGSGEQAMPFYQGSCKRLGWIAVCPNAVVAAMQQQQRARSQPQWYVVALNKQTGAQLWRQEIFEEPLPDGLLVDRDGNVVVTMVSGTLACLGPQNN